MPYIGKTPTVGNFQVCDAISVVNGQAAYTLQVGGVNVAPESANHMLVSLNGILQKPGSSFTISGSTMTFASNLATGDVIDFVQILGNVLDLGQPSDDTVTAAKLNDNVISGQTALAATPADTDEFLVSDAGTIKRIDYSYIKSTGGLVQLGTTDVSSATGSVSFDGIFTSDYENYLIIGNDILNATSDAAFRMRFRQSDSDITASNYVWHQQTLRDNGSTIRDDNAATGDNLIALTGGMTTSVTGNRVQFDVTLYNPLSTVANKICSFNAYNVYVGSGTNYYYTQKGHGFYNGNQNALSGVSFFFNSGNISDGRITVYGIKRS
jgi:hypothetical protein